MIIFIDCKKFSITVLFSIWVISNIIHNCEAFLSEFLVQFLQDKRELYALIVIVN
jgi:hypothetical protein